jgi:streptomycin 6-kinase
VGELEYEIGAIIRNPVEQPDFVSTPAVVERRLRVVTDALQLNYRRALEWCFAQAVLSAIWGVEDGYQIRSDDAALKLARAIKPMLDPL